MTRTIASLTFGIAAALALHGAVLAAEADVAPRDVDFSFEGPFGTYDRAAAQRGLQVFRNVCSGCHSLKYLAFRNLEDIGYSPEEAAAIAAEYQIEDGPDESGEMFLRPGRLSDHMPGPFRNEAQARAANNGALPPDLSLIVKAREGGADYVFSLLTGYEDPPADEELRPGQYWNRYFRGHKLAMPQPLFDGMVSYEDGTDPTLEQMAKDVTTFLAWVAEPKMEARKEMGLSFLIYMAAFTILLFLTNKRIWRPVKEGFNPLGEK
ncbi:MAG: cytochrome c1 [Rhodothalassiaceae bacterium]